MATSGTRTFNLDIQEIIEEAYEQIGFMDTTGEDLRTAIRTLDLMLLDWVNDDVPLWGVSQFTVALTQDTQSYTLDASYVDIIDAVIRDSNNNDISATRLSMSEYLDRPRKDTSGRPIQYMVERNASGGHTLYVWPVASDGTYTFVAWGLRYLEDAGDDYTNNVDVPRRFLPALCAGLAYNLAKKKMMSNPEAILAILPTLKADYESTYQNAKWEDRERSNLYVRPQTRRGRMR